MGASAFTVQFSVTCNSTRPGQHVSVAGSWSDWSAAPASSFSGKGYPQWCGTVTIPASASAPLEYKFVIVNSNDGGGVRWEAGENRTLAPPAKAQQQGGSEPVLVDGGVFGGDGPPRRPHPVAQQQQKARGQNGTNGAPHGDGSFLDAIAVAQLDSFEKALVHMHGEKKSWRLRLNFVRRAFSDAPFAASIGFVPHSVDCLVTVSTYLTFLSTNQLACSEEGGHHRPCHAALEAQQIEAALDALLHPPAGADADADAPPAFAAFVARSIYPQLPSHASQFTASVPLTRIRDIAHRGDIPHEMKQEIKHTLQNKIHRCCGPEDIVTCANLIERVNRGGYNPDFVHQLNVFYGELREFFNASSVDDRMRYLQGGAAEDAAVQKLAGRVLALKEQFNPALEQIEALTDLRERLGAVLREGGAGGLSAEVRQKLRLADCELDAYAFTLFASVAKEVEDGCKAGVGQESWLFALSALGRGILNMSLSHILAPETKAAAAELLALAAAGDGVLDILRVKATVDRARKATVDFSTAITDVYTRRVLSLSSALNVDRRAAAVFAEAVVRSNVTFQTSRIADVTIRRARNELGLPNWDPLFNGKAVGKVIFVDSLGDVEERSPSEDVILVCKTADGEEDIPPFVVAVVLGHSIPHLSHLGVRARQAGVVFVCAEDKDVFEKVSSGPARGFKGNAKLVVSPGTGFAGLSEVEAAKMPATKSSAPAGKPAKVSVDIGKVDATDTAVLPLTRATRSNSSAKCTFAGRLSSIAESSELAFQAPDGVCVPFGVFKAAEKPHLRSVDKLIHDYDEAFTVGDTKATVLAAAALRSFIEGNFAVTDKILLAIQKALSGNKDTRVMVRSSANCEDLEEMSGAGLYDSISNVPVEDASRLRSAILSVWGSLWTRRAASSRAGYGVNHSSASMAVLVQLMVPAELSFVAFSHNPVDPDDSGNIYVELAVGMGETLASGATAGLPYRIRVNREDTAEVTVDSLASFGQALVPSASAAGGLSRTTIDYSKERLTTDEIYRGRLATRIAEVVLLLEAKLEGAQDIEGAVRDDTLYVVQARPQVSN